MKLPNLLTCLILLAVAFAAFAAITTALAHLCNALGWARAQRVTERVGIIIVAVEHVVEDVQRAAPSGAVAMGKAALNDLDELVAAVDPSGKGTLLVARAKLMAKAFGVTGLTIFLIGCGAAAPLAHMVQAEGRIITAGEPCLVSAYKAEQQACLDDHPDTAKTCVDDVRARWRPVVDALVDEHDTRCQLEPAKCPTKAVP